MQQDSQLIIVFLFQLDLCKNRLSKGLESLKECKRLKYLMLTGNRFKPSNELEVLEPLVSFVLIFNFYFILFFNF